MKLEMEMPKVFNEQQKKILTDIAFTYLKINRVLNVYSSKDNVNIVVNNHKILVSEMLKFLNLVKIEKIYEINLDDNKVYSIKNGKKKECDLCSAMIDSFNYYIYYYRDNLGITYQNYYSVKHFEVEHKNI